MWSRLSLLVGFLIWRLHIKEFIQGNSLCNNLSTRIGNLALFIVALLPRLWTRQPCSPQGLCSSWTCRALPPHTCICLVVTFSGRPACLASPTITVSQVLYCTFLFSWNIQFLTLIIIVYFLHTPESELHENRGLCVFDHWGLWST